MAGLNLVGWSFVIATVLVLVGFHVSGTLASILALTGLIVLLVRIADP